MKTHRIILTLALMLLCTASAAAFDFLLDQGQGMGRTILLSDPSPTALVNVPTGGYVERQWRVVTGYNREYDLSDFDEVFIAGAYRWRSFVSAVGLSKFGKSDLYSELIGKWMLAVQIDSFMLGANLSGKLLQFGGGYDNLNAVTFGLGGSYRSKRLLAAVAVDNLTSPKVYETAVPTNPKYSLYGEFVGKQSFSVTGRMTFESDESPQFALGQRINFTPSAAAFFGLSTGPTRYGAGVEFKLKSGTFSYSLSNHPVLGVSQTIAVSYGGGGRPHGREDDFR